MNDPKVIDVMTHLVVTFRRQDGKNVESNPGGAR